MAETGQDPRGWIERRMPGRILAPLRPDGLRRRRMGTTWWALAMYGVVLTLGSAILGLLLSVLMSRVKGTAGYPVETLGSIIPALAVLMLALLQLSDLALRAVRRRAVLMAPPIEAGLNPWVWAVIIVPVMIVAFMAARRYW